MKNLYKVLIISLSFVTANVYAALIDGSMIVGGAYNATGGTDLSDATGLTLDTVYANGGSGDILSTFDINTPAGTGGSVSLDNFVSVSNFLTVGGWTLNLTGLSIIDQTTGVLNLAGTGVLSGNTVSGVTFDPTNVTWSFSSQSLTSYSMTVTPVPVPAAIWLFGSGLIGLVAVSRRKA